VADGKQELRVRQLPGGANSMGAIKFMMPNEYGIYLHDTPNKALFNEENRWISNGCVRLEDAERLARWIFGAMPAAADRDRESYQQLRDAVPVYLTYLTVGTAAGGATFRADPYDRDRAVLERFADAGDGMKDAKPRLQIDFTDPAPAVAAAKAPQRSPARPDKDAGGTEARTAAATKAGQVAAAASTPKVKVTPKTASAPKPAAKPLTRSKAASPEARAPADRKVDAPARKVGATSGTASAKPLRATKTPSSVAANKESAEVARQGASRAPASPKPVKEASPKKSGTAAAKPRPTQPGKSRP